MIVPLFGRQAGLATLTSESTKRGGGENEGQGGAE